MCCSYAKCRRVDGSKRVEQVGEVFRDNLARCDPVAKSISHIPGLIIANFPSIGGLLG